jgi:hypothetical protein
MNTYAKKTDAALYAASIARKRNSGADRPQGLCEDFKQGLHTGRKKVLPEAYNTRSATNAIVKFFNGTVVTGYAPAVEWGSLDSYF